MSFVLWQTFRMDKGAKSICGKYIIHMYGFHVAMRWESALAGNR